MLPKVKLQSGTQPLRKIEKMVKKILTIAQTFTKLHPKMWLHPAKTIFHHLRERAECTKRPDTKEAVDPMLGKQKNHCLSKWHHRMPSNTALLFPDQEECIMSTVAKVPKLFNTIKSEVPIKYSHLNRLWEAIYQLPRLRKVLISATKVRPISTRTAQLKAIRTWGQTLLMDTEDLLVQLRSRTGRICSQGRVKRKGRVQRRGELLIIKGLPKEMNIEHKMVAWFHRSTEVPKVIIVIWVREATREVIREVLLWANILVGSKIHNNNKICNNNSTTHQAITIRLASNRTLFTIQVFQWVWEDSPGFHLERTVLGPSWVVINSHLKSTLLPRNNNSLHKSLQNNSLEVIRDHTLLNLSTTCQQMPRGLAVSMLTLPPKETMALPLTIFQTLLSPTIPQLTSEAWAAPRPTPVDSASTQVPGARLNTLAASTEKMWSPRWPAKIFSMRSALRMDSAPATTLTHTTR